MATVTFDHVNKVYGDFQAVKDLNLEIGDGEFMVLVGPSGCGKTTSLRMIAGLEEISSGDAPHRRPGRQRRRRPRTATSRWCSRATRSTRTCPCATTSRSASSCARSPRPRSSAGSTRRPRCSSSRTCSTASRKELSGGQRQRVALGRAIVREPAVFLMDEPLSNLDAKLRVQTRAEIARLHQRLKTTVVYVTHDQVEAMTMGQRIAVMSEGLLQQVGTPQELYDHPVNRFVAGFIGSPAMNFVELSRSRTATAGRPGLTGRSRCRRAPAMRWRRVAARSSRLPPGAPRARRGRSRVRHVPGTGRRRRVPRQRGAAPRQRRRPGHRRDRRLRPSRPARATSSTWSCRSRRCTCSTARPARPSSRRRRRRRPPERRPEPDPAIGPGGSLRGRSA